MNTESVSKSSNDSADASDVKAPSKEMMALLHQLMEEDSSLPDPTTLSAAEGRKLAIQNNKRWNAELPVVKRTDELAFRAADGHTIRGRMFTPKTVEPGLILFIHGGGFAFCNIETHERCARLLANEAHCSVLSIDYRLAPEHPYPAGLQDCITVFRQLQKVQEKYPTTNGPIAVAGDSAGANLALALIINEQSLCRPAPDFALLFYGVYGTDFNTRSYIEFQNGPGLTRAKMMRYIDWYIEPAVRDDPLVAPLSASDEVLRRLPPLYLNAAEIDPLCSDTELLAERLQQSGRKDEVQVVSGVVHGFMQMTLRLPAACRATTDAANAFRRFAGHQRTHETTRSSP
ncbi:MAG: alpha/beta hydrolase [Granulosicoccus sp.]